MTSDQRAPELPMIAAEWPRNARELIRVKLDTYRGSAVVDIRCWYPDRATSERKPGRSGITLAVAHLPALAAAINEALERARRLELLPPAE